MKAAVVPELGAKLEIREVAVPEPGAGQVLVKIEAARRRLDDVNACFDEVLAGRVPARLVFTF
jgi:propanol-preferring alcohol dehydrogenase